ncbi:hypothetical protein OH77DRAFT_169617 [Trametes cingulata]|nr:hypothetical protein OH77DRAFT_169617 [Trametes cingulata]
MSFKTLLFAVTTAALASSALAASLEISTPSVAKQCELTTLQFAGGAGENNATATHSQSFLPLLMCRRLPPAIIQDPSSSVQTAGQTIEQFELPAGSTVFNWNTNVAAGTPVDLKLVDSTGAIAQTAQFVIAPGADACTLV